MSAEVRGQLSYGLETNAKLAAQSKAAGPQIASAC